MITRQIEPHHFLQRKKGDTNQIPLPGEVFAWMMDHLRRYSAVPSIDLAKARWPLFEFIEVSDPIEAIIDDFDRNIKRRELIHMCRELAEVCDDWDRIADADVIAFEAASALAKSVPNSTVTRYSDSLNRLALYRARQETGDVPGISLIVPEIDAFTYGIQPNDLCIIEGFLGVKKSSLAVLICAKAYFERGETSLFHSLEMDGDKLAARWDAYAADFRYSAMKRLQLTDVDLQKWEEAGERASDTRFDKDILVIDDVRRPTADRIYSDIQKWRPQFSIIDTIDEVRAPANLKAHWEQQDYVARELKGVARSTKTALFGIAQAGRDAEQDGATLGNVAGSITIPRKADVVIGLHATPQMKKMHQIEFRLLKNRDDKGEGTKFTKYWDPGMMDIRPWTQSDAVATKAAS